MNKNRINALKNAGLDAEQYFSLRLSKEYIPDGAEVVIQIRDQNTGELRSVPLDTVLDGCFAPNSRFYRQTMADGHTFNPYIHRRFLPAQFRRNIRAAGYSGIREYVRRSYDWNYVVRFLCEECAKLALLERRDKEAFQERSQFFTLDDIKAILDEYVCEVFRALELAKLTPYTYYTHNGHKQTYFLVANMGRIQQEHVRPMQYRFRKFHDAAVSCSSYAQLSKLLNGFHFCKIDKTIPSSERFARCFIESGAFYTLKQMIMFEGLRLEKADDVQQSLERLKSYGKGRYLSLYCVRHL